MTRTLNTFSLPELRLLGDHIGSTFDSIAGNGLPDYLTSTEIFIVTSHGVLHLWCDSVEYEFQSYSEDFSTWTLDKESEGLQDATNQGDRYFFHKGEELLSAELVRETTREISFGETSWEYETDIAVILNLAGGKLVIQRTDLNVELLTARFLEANDQLEIPPSDAYWEVTVDTHYEVKREVLAVQSLLEERR